MIAMSVLNNNVSLSPLSRANFANNLDRSLAGSTAWITKQFSFSDSGDLIASDLAIELVSNPPLAHMFVDSSAMSNNPRLQAICAKVVAEYRRSHQVLVAKLVDPTISGPPIGAAAMEEYLRWLLHDISPGALPLSDAEQADMLSPDKNSMYNLTHQLFALYILRKFHGDTPELQGLMDRVENHVAREAAFDFRVSDLYLERIAFLLAAGRPDLVKSRWVERALAEQQPDGGWRYTWYGWGPHLFDYTPADERSAPHSTALGMWLTSMLKHRYPQWIETNYR
jgi:hypothetical protein